MTSARLSPLSALSIARRVGAGDLTVEAAIEDQLDRIAALEPQVMAFTAHDADQVRAAARGARGALAGLTIGIKDIIDTADWPTQMGSALYQGHQPPADAPVVARARQAGAVVAGKTVTTEFAFFSPGPTRNPHHLAHTPGGSSSGSAAAVAAGMIPAAVGTQTGGSVIRPAAFCGVAGFKPSYKLIPTVGMKTFSWSLDTLGFFAASVADVAFVAQAIVGRPLAPRADAAPPRLALVRTHLWGEAAGEMHEALETAAARARVAGAVVIDVTLAGVFAEAFAAHQVVQDYEAAWALAHEHATGRDQLSPILRETLDAGRALDPARYDEARGIAHRARKAAFDLFEGVDAVLTPSAPGAAPEGLASTGSSIFNRLWTLLGCPCVNVPGLINPRGLPLGVQVVAPFGEDARALEVANWLEGVIQPR